MQKPVTLAGVLEDLKALQQKYVEQEKQIGEATHGLGEFQQELQAAQEDCEVVQQNTVEAINRLEAAQAHLKRLEVMCDSGSSSRVEFTIGPVSEKTTHERNNQ